MIPYFTIEKIDLGFISVNAWGIMIALAFLVSVWVAYREAKRVELNPERILDLGIIILIAAFIGARIFYILNEWEQFSNDFTQAYRIWEGGLTIYGGFIGAILGAVLYLKIHKLDFWRYADVLAFVLPLGISIGRIGCFMIHDHLGRITTLPWGFQMPSGELRHETALYEIIFGLILFIVFLMFRKKEFFLKQSGRTFLSFLVLYGLFRLGSDFLRATDLKISDPIVWLNLHPSQWFSLGAIILGSMILWYRARRVSN
ncbi:prolipoprotein diacylglyceryl transferase [Patescibacteria group bacterium]|nr:prolipoprotein diacylglyceryl transferase [Patescibacteria group bacterium]MBU1890930.1 prolipoprotein diacylglyceryl transferase [Patescibacteria group bacterium]